jgi:two-component system, LytTR family, response regulator
VGEHLKAIQVTDILFFFSRDKGTFAQTTDKRRYLLDYTLDQVERMIDPARFFRISRQYIVSFEAIKDMVSFTNSRLKLILHHADDHTDVVVSREKVNDFKAWLDR